MKIKMLVILKKIEKTIKISLGLLFITTLTSCSVFNNNSATLNSEDISVDSQQTPSLQFPKDINPKGESITSISEKYLGQPYLLSPLGEGDSGKYDTNPLIRFDGFDCQTFVETVLAEYLSGQNGATIEENLNKIRYSNGTPSLITRNHFISADWLVNNANLVQRVPMPDEITEIVKINKTDWLTKTRGINFAKPIIEYGTMTYVPLNKIQPDLIPNNAIIFVIRDFTSQVNSLGTDMLVSHIGFAIRKNDLTLYFRHASLNKKLVTDMPFENYFNKLIGTKIKGIAIYTIK